MTTTDRAAVIERELLAAEEFEELDDADERDSEAVVNGFVENLAESDPQTAEGMALAKDGALNMDDAPWLKEETSSAAETFNAFQAGLENAQASEQAAEMAAGTVTETMTVPIEQELDLLSADIREAISGTDSSDREINRARIAEVSAEALWDKMEDGREGAQEALARGSGEEFARAMSEIQEAATDVRAMRDDGRWPTRVPEHSRGELDELLQERGGGLIDTVNERMGTNWEARGLRNVMFHPAGSGTLTDAGRDLMGPISEQDAGLLRGRLELMSFGGETGAAQETDVRGASADQRMTEYLSRLGELDPAVRDRLGDAKQAELDAEDAPWLGEDRHQAADNMIASFDRVSGVLAEQDAATMVSNAMTDPLYALAERPNAMENRSEIAPENFDQLMQSSERVLQQRIQGTDFEAFQALRNVDSRGMRAAVDGMEQVAGQISEWTGGEKWPDAAGANGYDRETAALLQDRATAVTDAVAARLTDMGMDASDRAAISEAIYTTGPDGNPTLTETGQAALDGISNADRRLMESELNSARDR